jgi:hypothetical protein
VPKIVGNFAGWKGNCEAADAAAQALELSARHLAQTGLELLNGISIGFRSDEYWADTRTCALFRSRTLHPAYGTQMPVQRSQGHQHLEQGSDRFGCDKEPATSKKYRNRMIQFCTAYRQRDFALESISDISVLSLGGRMNSTVSYSAPAVLGVGFG